jgi:hypothetical protein
MTKQKDIAAKKEYQDRIQTRCQNHEMTELANGKLDYVQSNYNRICRRNTYRGEK